MYVHACLTTTSKYEKTSMKLWPFNMCEYLLSVLNVSDYFGDTESRRRVGDAIRLGVE